MYRIARLLALVLLAVIFVSISSAQKKTSLTSSPLSMEQLNVYRAFLRNFAVRPLRNLASTTVPLDLNGMPEGRPCLRGIQLTNLSVPLGTIHSFGPETTKGLDLRLVDSLEQAKLRQQRDAEKSRDGAQTPGSSLNYVVLSEIAFDAKDQFAVVKYLLVCGDHCMSGATIVMKKVEGTWTTDSRRPCAFVVDQLTWQR